MAAYPKGRAMTPRGQMSGTQMGPAIDLLPPQVKAMFDPRPQPPHLPLLFKRRGPQLTGVASLVDQFEKETPAPAPPFETPRQRQRRRREERQKANEERIVAALEDWDPAKDPKATNDAYKTLFVARISYDTTEKKLRREFEQFGPITSIRMVLDKDEQPRGYAFIEYETEDGMRQAYKRADGRKIDGRRVLVDVERGRTVKGWKPRRLGGGIGNPRKDKPRKGEDEAEMRARLDGFAPPPSDAASHPPADHYGGGGRGDSRERNGGGGGARGGSRERGRDTSRYGTGDDGGRYGGGGGGDVGKYGPGAMGGGGNRDRSADRGRKRSRSRDRYDDDSKRRR